MLTLNHTKEGLSRAYVSAVAYSARVNLALAEDHFDYGVDGAFKLISSFQGNLFTSGTNLEFQIKATQLWEERDGQIVYRLALPGYNTLALRMQAYRKEESSTPKILLLLCLPKGSDADWLECDQEYLTLRRCCYWGVIEGPTLPGKKTAKTTIKVPTTNRLTPAAVLELLERTKRGKL